jgi:hypothetical protein
MEWRRAFFLDSKLRPTRRNVLSDPYYRIRADRPWFVQEQPHIDLEAAVRNAATLRRVEERNQFRTEDGYFKHRVCEVTLKELFDVLVGFEVRGADVPGWYGQLVTLRDILDADPDARVQLVRMDSPRERSVVNGSLKLHQGRSSSKAADKYPGDAKMCDSLIATVQIHWLQIEDVAIGLIPAIGVHIPQALRKDDVVAQGV